MLAFIFSKLEISHKVPQNLHFETLGFPLKHYCDLCIIFGVD